MSGRGIVSRRILLPLSLVFTVVLLSQGVVQNLHGNTVATTIDQSTGIPTQAILGGPFASQEAIRQLGSNGGGPYNTNSAHPFENPTGFTDMMDCSRSW